MQTLCQHVVVTSLMKSHSLALQQLLQHLVLIAVVILVALCLHAHSVASYRQAVLPAG
jgi:hypothetical protein